MNEPHTDRPLPLSSEPRRGADRFKIVVACVALAIVAIGSLWLRGKPFASRAKSDAGEVVAEGDAKSSPLRDVPALHLDRDLLAKVADGTIAERLVREPAAFENLLNESKKLGPGDLEALGAEIANAARLQEDPAAARGKPFVVRGTLEAIERPRTLDASQPPASEGGRRDVRGVLRDASGARFLFSVLELPDGESDLVGQAVKVEGFFFKLFAREAAPGRYDDSLVYLVGRRLARSFVEMQKNDDLGTIPFIAARDRTPAEMIEWPDSLVYATLNWIRSIAPARLRELPVADVDWTELRREPDHYRGLIVRVVGPYHPELAWLRRLGEDGENPLGRRDFHEGLLKLHDDHLFRWLAFDGVTRAPGMENADESESQALVLEGVFIKNVAWLNARNDLVSGPLIVATRLESRPIADERSIVTIAFVIVGLTAICLLFCLYGIYSDGQKTREFQREYLTRRRQRQGRNAAARAVVNEGQPPASSPGSTS